MTHQALDLKRQHAHEDVRLDPFLCPVEDGTTLERALKRLNPPLDLGELLVAPDDLGRGAKDVPAGKAIPG